MNWPHTPLLPWGSRESAQALVLYNTVNKYPIKQGSTAQPFQSQNLHEGVIDGDDKSLTSLLELRVVDETRDMGAGARGAWKMVSPDREFCLVQVQVTHWMQLGCQW